mgnify:CR=1 FL=1
MSGTGFRFATVLLIVGAGLTAGAAAQDTKSARGTVTAVGGDSITVKVGERELKFAGVELPQLRELRSRFSDAQTSPDPEAFPPVRREKPPKRGQDPTLPEMRRVRLLEMADAMDMFCQGTDGEMFDRDGTPWPEADITLVDLATYAREGYNAQLSIAYISLISTVNNIAERDQYLGRPIINVTDEGHIITKNQLLAPYVVKITKMWRKLGAWFWLATQNIDDLPRAAEPMLNMIEWWICLSMPPDEVEKIARFRELSPAQKALMLSARKEAGKFTEGVILSKSMEVLFRAVPPSLYLALAQTEPEEKAERYQLMQQYGCTELEAAFKVAEKIDQARGIESPALELS